MHFIHGVAIIIVMYARYLCWPLHTFTPSSRSPVKSCSILLNPVLSRTLPYPTVKPVQLLNLRQTFKYLSTQYLKIHSYYVLCEIKIIVFSCLHNFFFVPKTLRFYFECNVYCVPKTLRFYTERNVNCYFRSNNAF